MTRLHIIAEGQTEQKFVREVLAPYLWSLNIVTDSRCVLTSRDKTGKSHRGGLTNYQKAKNDIVRWIKQEHHNDDCYFSTMFDYYALPNDFPGWAESLRIADKYSRIEHLEKAMKEDIEDRRFIPYIQLHEFEALVFADLQRLKCEYFGYEAQIERLSRILENNFSDNPELIDDGPDTAPSKRIILEIREYDKASAGVNVANNIGIQTLRRRCRHFNDWLAQLENIAAIYKSKQAGTLRSGKT